MFKEANTIEVGAKRASQLGGFTRLTSHDQDRAKPFLQATHPLRNGRRGDA